MRSVGMIAEFNPFHAGHAYALAEARRQTQADVVVVVMTGNFVQRGEAAIVDKWRRTQMALAGGADLVVELPLSAAVQSAQQFAEGGVQQLAALGIQTLAFGTELPDLDYRALAMQRLALEARETSAAFNADYRQTYASQLAQFYAHASGGPITDPNAMLGLAYAEAVVQQAPDMALLPLTRTGSNHDDQALSGQFASASAIRAALLQGDDVGDLMPVSARAALKDAHLTTWADFWPLLRYRLQTATLTELRAIDQMSEGLEYRLTRAAADATDFGTYLHAAKSKRYTYARLRRLSLNVLLNLRRQEVIAARQMPVIHVLGFNAAGRALLHDCRGVTELPLVTRVSAAQLAPNGALALTQQADSLIETLTGRRQNYGRRPLMEGDL